ncbi:MAG: AAA family ATPase [Acidobacteriia bacterium]|nr:AAA family ATPase [Terriglobia bacterium]
MALLSSGRIITFYSYKGGTGRSMALANVAWVLASSGARVLVVDWDLEAPGLHRYFRPFLNDKELIREESAGLIDFMTDFVQTMATPLQPSESRKEDWYEKHADISKWTKRLLWPSGEDAKTSLGGYIDFVPAGRQGPGYARRVNSFDWAGFYEKYNGGAFLDAVRRAMVANYDWVLIDSRTGVSDTSGICTIQLPDTLVACFTLNYQSIDGTAAVAKSAATGTKRNLRILPLPTRLDGNEEQMLKAMMTYARTAFEPCLEPHIDRDAYWLDMGVPYFSRYAYSEKLAPFEVQVSRSTSTLPAMERLASHITEGRVTSLQALPEPYREQTLAEFEQLPETALQATESKKVNPDRVLMFARRGWYQLRTNMTLVSLVAVSVAGLEISKSGLDWWRRLSSSPQNPISTLIADARKELEAGRNREHGALLIAEAAARLDPASVVGPGGSADAQQLYQALMELQPLTLQKSQKDTVLIRPDGLRMVGVAAKQGASLFRLPPQGNDKGSSAGYSAAAFSPDNRFLAAGGRNGSLLVMDADSGRQVWQWENPDPNSAWVIAVTFSPSGNLLAAATDTGDIVISAVDPWKELKRFKQLGVRILAFTPDSAYLSAAGFDTVHWWTPKSDKAVESFRQHKKGVVAMAMSLIEDKQRRMVTIDYVGTARLWTQTANLPEVTSIANEPGLDRLAFSPDGHLLAVSGKKDTKIFEMTDGKSNLKTSLATGELTALTFSEDGRWLLTGSFVGTAQIWDVATWRPLQKVDFAAAVASLALTPNRKYLAVASGDRVSLALTQVTGLDQGFPASQVRGLACSQTERQLTLEEWKTYFGNEPLRYTCGQTSAAH